MALRQWSSEIYTAEFRELQASTFCCSRDGRLGLLAGIVFQVYQVHPGVPGAFASTHSSKKLSLGQVDTLRANPWICCGIL